MPGKDLGGAARGLAQSVAKQAIWLAGFSVAALVLVPAAALAWGTRDVVAGLALGLAVAAGLLTLGLSAVLRLSAALFQLMASHGDEISGGMRADEFLARAGLQAEPAVIRRLTDRAASARRLQGIQRLSLAAFLTMTVLTFAALSF